MNKMNGYQCMNHHFPLIFFLLLYPAYGLRQIIQIVKLLTVTLISSSPSCLNGSSPLSSYCSHCIYSNIYHYYFIIVQMFYQFPILYRDMKWTYISPFAALMSHNRFYSSLRTFLVAADVSAPYNTHRFAFCILNTSGIILCL